MKSAVNGVRHARATSIKPIKRFDDVTHTPSRINPRNSTSYLYRTERDDDEKQHETYLIRMRKALLMIEIFVIDGQVVVDELPQRPKREK
jgi:hypothetical protein